jgi:hypothetical protein
MEGLNFGTTNLAASINIVGIWIFYFKDIYVVDSLVFAPG